MKKYYYVEEVCKASHYRSLNPVAYEKTSADENALYQKVHMACSAIETGKCTHANDCLVFQAAPVTISKEREWRLYQEKL